jgi:hypothetical protein
MDRPLGMLETRGSADQLNHGNNPRMFMALRPFSTPIAMAAIRCEILSVLERAIVRSKA